MNAMSVKSKDHASMSSKHHLFNEVKIEGQDELLLKSLLKFYRNNKDYLKIVGTISGQKTNISLREIDFTVTNYGRDKPIIYTIDDTSSIKTKKNFNLYLDYKRQLKGYSKRLFDPFCRRQRIYVSYDLVDEPIYLEDSDIENYKHNEDGIVTTIGQLNFFRWAIDKNVIDFCFNNKDLIKKEMEKIDNIKQKNKISKTSEKRQLSKNNKTVHREETRVIIQFP
jgi:hypothetical protein